MVGCNIKLYINVLPYISGIIKSKYFYNNIVNGGINMKMVTIKLPKWLSSIVLRFMKSSK